MLKRCFSILFLCCFSISFTQTLSENTVEQDTIKKSDFLKSIGNGYLPTRYFDFDLRYLLKFNQYEGVRTGLGGITNNEFSEKFSFNAYTVYGFKDRRYKFSIGAGLRLNKDTSTWLNVSYTDDLQETGSTKFLTDTRFFQFFEPRLLNIDLFHKHITQAVTLKHQLSNKLSTTTEFSRSKISPTYNYGFNTGNTTISDFRLCVAKVSLQWSPFSEFELTEKGLKETKQGFPKFTIQYSKSFKDIFKSDFNFSKLDFRTVHRFGNETDKFTEITLVSGLTSKDIPLTHLYHAYPNNINKETVMQRFSVAGLNSFETMFFNEFFSDKFTTIQLKHYIKPFLISARFKPQMILITRYAIGDMEQPERHENITFGSLKKGYTESGFEINKLLFGFGLSFTYRYGAYHLPEFEDNIAFKFTFNLTL